MAFFHKKKCYFYIILPKNLHKSDKSSNFVAGTEFGIMVTTLLITIALIIVAMVLLSVRVLFKKNGRFKSMHISDSRAMRERGIGCVQSQDREARRPKANKIDVKNL